MAGGQIGFIILDLRKTESFRSSELNESEMDKEVLGTRDAFEPYGCFGQCCRPGVLDKNDGHTELDWEVCGWVRY